MKNSLKHAWQFGVSLGLAVTVTGGHASATQGEASRDAPVGDPMVYKRVDGRELRAWVTRPSNAQAGERRPAVVFFHGGGWVGGTPSQFNEQARYLASRGLVAIQIEYRLLKGKVDPPTICCRDARSAIRWVRSRAGDLGVDPVRLAAAGGSAGGHLAAFVGMVDGMEEPEEDRGVSGRPNALLLFNPVFDNGPDGWGTQRVGDRYREFSPAHNISKDDPPAIVFLGTQDRLIPVKTVERFRDTARQVGMRCEAHFYEGQGHGFFNREPWRTRTLIETDKFLASLGWLKGAPTLPEP